MPKPENLPPEFEERCPLCQHEGFNWGRFRAKNAAFVPDGKAWIWWWGRRAAAECPRCGYLMIFNRKPEE